MRIFTSVCLNVLLLFAGTAFASVPRIAVISIDSDEFAPFDELLKAVSDELAGSGRFEVADFDSSFYVTVSPDSLINRLQILASEHSLDLFLALEVLPAQEYDRTVFRSDSILTYRSVTVDVLGRFYSSTGSLFGTMRNSSSREDVLTFAPDPSQVAIVSAMELAARSILELFPIEVSFIASGSQVFDIPMGTRQGLVKGMVMAVVASSSAIPTDLSDYASLRSRGLLQIVDADTGQSRARLLSGRLVAGGSVTAIEHSSPAILYLDYAGLLMSVEPGEGLEETSSEWGNNIRLGVETGKWGLSFGGGIRAGGIEHASGLGIDIFAGTRIPLSSPSIGLRLSGGGDLMFLMQDVRSDTLVSNASAVTFAVIVDASLEYMFSEHLGANIGASGVLGTSADSWSVQEYTGVIRDANPDEIYYTSIKHGPLSVHVGIVYFIY